GRQDRPHPVGGADQAGCQLRAEGSSLRLIQTATDCEVRERDDETVDQRIVSPVKKAGHQPEAFIWERCARISSRPGRNSGPLARGRIHLCRLAPSPPNDPCMDRAGHTFFARRSFNAAWSSIASASRRLSFAFSLSSSLSRLASDT